MPTIPTPRKLRKFTKKRSIFASPRTSQTPWGYFWDGGCKYDWRWLSPDFQLKPLPADVFGVHPQFETQSVEIPPGEILIQIPVHKAGFVHLYYNGETLPKWITD